MNNTTWRMVGIQACFALNVATTITKLKIVQCSAQMIATYLWESTTSLLLHHSYVILSFWLFSFCITALADAICFRVRIITIDWPKIVFCSSEMNARLSLLMNLANTHIEYNDFHISNKCNLLRIFELECQRYLFFWIVFHYEHSKMFLVSFMCVNERFERKCLSISLCREYVSVRDIPAHTKLSLGPSKMRPERADQHLIVITFERYLHQGAWCSYAFSTSEMFFLSIRPQNY